MYLTLVTVLIVEDHVYVQRCSNGDLVWIGRVAEVERMTPVQQYQLIGYRLAFDAEHTRTVH